MKKSEFQFSTPQITALKFAVNGEFDREANPTVDLAVELKQQVLRSREKNTYAYVEAQIRIGTEDASTPFSLSLTISAHFRWKENVYTEAELKTLLEKNAMSLLISYARPIIAVVTNASPFNAYNIPFVNLIDEETSG